MSLWDTRKLVDKGTVGLVELLAGIVLSIGQQTEFFVHSIDSNHWVCHLGDLGGGRGRGNSSSLVATWGRGHASSQQGTCRFDGSSLEQIEIYACIIYVYIYILYISDASYISYIQPSKSVTSKKLSSFSRCSPFTPEQHGLYNKRNWRVIRLISCIPSDKIHLGQ